LVNVTEEEPDWPPARWRAVRRFYFWGFGSVQKLPIELECDLPPISRIESDSPSDSAPVSNDNPFH